MDNNRLKVKLSKLEFLHDQLMSEYCNIDQILQAIGFPYGMASLKEVADDLIKENAQQSKLDIEN